MIIYAMRNENGEYISMSGGRTKNWLESSKFDESQVEWRLEYTSEEFKLVKFKVEEID